MLKTEATCFFYLPILHPQFYGNLPIFAAGHEWRDSTSPASNGVYGNLVFSLSGSVYPNTACPCPSIKNPWLLIKHSESRTPARFIKIQSLSILKYFRTPWEIHIPTKLWDSEPLIALQFLHFGWTVSYKKTGEKKDLEKQSESERCVQGKGSMEQVLPSIPVEPWDQG